MTDLGAGVVEYPDEEPVTNGRPGPLVPRVPTCPWCGLHDRTTRVDHPDGIYLCSCGSLFNATDREWWALKKHREAATRRRKHEGNDGQ